MTTLRVDLNCDLGESFGHYSIGQDDALLEITSSASIACGYHAGDPNIMARTVKAAMERGVSIGAHPGLPDLQGFGRRAMAVTEDEVYNLTLYQIGALAAFARRHRQSLHHVKPHGALYNLAETEPPVARAIARAVHDFDGSLVLFGLAGGRLVQAGRDVGLQAAAEAFVDRAYQHNGFLLPRTTPGAVICDPQEAARRSLRLVTEGCLTAVDGTDLEIIADTLCIHGDEPMALALAQAVHAALTTRGIEIKPPGGV